ncbi:AMP-binding protein [Bradyrhizobium sp. 24]|uniref:acyl-CoA synthetase n=1 Tax=unclassified Bradyrhizobium TaxID=2631580 RepID=UPI001FFA0817|nr:MULTISPECIES: acyl-CoA synthetase [unclassified Bradyrhizobium]MCK1299513.1 AMP-binding protein [Bradyrhizobium sp. 37]MCK1382264.1 AMP-binding protein [Bradyrhizobium sp. 24]MCK1768864.1 AMP-binding protein [Bradyrhizobium sp. 134]
MIISGERQISYDDIRARIKRAMSGFRALGLAEAAPVAMMLRNDFALFEVVAASAALGSPVVPINWHLKAEEVRYILADSGAKILVCHADLLPQIRDGIPADVLLLVVATPPELAATFSIPRELTEIPVGLTDWDRWRDDHPQAQEPPRRAAAMIYTSGTTGMPKGVRRMPMQPEQAAASERVGGIAYGVKPRENQIVLINGPMYHSAPHSYGMLAFRSACTIILQARFDAEELLALIERHRVTHIHMVPTMFVRLLRLPEAVRQRYDLSSLRFVVHGAAPCPPDVKRAMIDWWGPVINEYFGSTETGIPVWHSAEEALKKPGTVGRAIEGGIVRIFRDDGSPCGANEIGEIYMRQTAVPDFDYHGRTQARAEAGRDGLVSVGDVGYLDEDGYLFLCDRKRDMVISGGVNIYPAEIENVLIGMPGVRDCAVFGIPDAEFGERLCAFVEPESDAGLSADAVRSFLRERLANFKVPKDVEFRDALPREATGKIFKRKLRDRYWAT